MRSGIFLILIALAAGCAAGSNPTGSENAVQTSPIPSQTALPAAPTLAPTPLRTSTPTGPVRLAIWMPEVLAPQDNAAAADLRDGWQTDFSASEENAIMTIRLKKASDVGGILSTLRSASLVAPSDLPDLTLLRRTDLLAAYGAGLIEPLDATAFAAITEDMHPAVLALGMTDSVLIGLPYTVDITHLAVQPNAMPTDASAGAWKFDAVLERGGLFLFPAGRAAILNDTFLAQYRAANGSLDANSLPVDVDTLESVLSFYERGITSGLIPPDVLTYTSSGDYTSRLLDTEAAMGIMTSTTYLNLQQAGATLDFAPLPTLSGDPTTVIDGWVWVITTMDAGRQALALRFLDWIFDLDRHATYANAVNMLPTGRTTLRRIDDDAYAAFADSLLSRATLPLTDAAGGVTGRAMQAALVAVLQGQRTARDAALDVIEQLNAG